MNEPIKIEVSPDRSACVTLSTAFAAGIRLTRKPTVAVRFGNLRCLTAVKLEGGLAENRVLFSRGLAEALHLPTSPVYELKLTGSELTVGPYIGLLLSRADRRLTPARLRKALIYVRQYEALHGAVVLFALDRVDKTLRLLEGYCYNPAAGRFERGVFPYPAAIFRRVGLDDEWKNHFLSAIGDTVFNSRYVGKREMTGWLLRDPEIGPHIPETWRYHSPQRALALLRAYGSLYIKPSAGRGGHGILKTAHQSDKWIFQQRRGAQNLTTVCAREAEALAFLRGTLSRGNFLIQRTIPLLTLGGSVIDFRCAMQKDQAKRWICRAVIGRCGARGSIVSNISSGGRAFLPDELERMGLRAPGIRPGELGRTLCRFALRVCRALDEGSVNWGNLGLDVGVDDRGRLWLIEVNNRDPDPTIALDLHDEALYEALKTGPLFYAKALAGFPDETDGPYADFDPDRE